MTRRRGGRIGAEAQYLLWPKLDGLINLEGLPSARLSGSQSRHWRRLPRVVKVSESLSRRVQSSLSLWFWRRSGGPSFYAGSLPAFETWLLNGLQSEDFGAVTLGGVIDGAVSELGISAEAARRFVAQATRPGGTFASDGVVIWVKE